MIEKADVRNPSIEQRNVFYILASHQQKLYCIVHNLLGIIVLSNQTKISRRNFSAESKWRTGNTLFSYVADRTSSISKSERYRRGWGWKP